MGVSQNLGYFLGGLYDEDYNILGSISGSPYLGKGSCRYYYYNWSTGIAVDQFVGCAFQKYLHYSRI